MIDVKKISDTKLITLYNSSPQMGLDMFYLKYEDVIYKSKKIYNWAGLEYDDKQLAVIVDEYREKIFKPSKEDFTERDFIGDRLLEMANSVIKVMYEATEMEIPFENYREYVFMVIGVSDEELKRSQDEKFAYIDRPLVDEEAQIYYSLELIEGYLFDLNSSGEGIEPEKQSIINTSLKEIDECLRLHDVETAKFKLVSLQMLFHLEVRFLPVLNQIIQKRLPLRNFVDFDNTGTKGKGRIR